MSHFYLLTDGSVHSQSKVGYGAYLVLSDLNMSVDDLKETVNLKRFEPTSSSKLELQTLLWALNDMIMFSESDNMKLTVYTDSQTIVKLPGRRDHLEHRQYESRHHNRLHQADLYQAFFRLTDRLSCEFVKVVGHQASGNKDKIGHLFSLVDQAARRALRNELA